MIAPVGDYPNNCGEVEKTSQGKYSAEVGEETFEVMIRLSLLSGRRRWTIQSTCLVETAMILRYRSAVLRSETAS